jgi:hypothetical protein
MNNRIEEYLRQAREADAQAESLPEGTLRSGWLRIAQEYRALANTSRLWGKEPARSGQNP